MPDFAHGSIISKIDGTHGYELSVTPEGKVRFQATDLDGNTFAFEECVNMADTGWHYVGLCLNRSTGTLSVKIDAYGPFTASWDGLGNVSCSSNFIIGGGTSDFQGRIDEISVYNKLVSIGEMDDSYTALWNTYVAEYGITDDGELVTDNDGRIVVDEIL
jgi:hypothetical protein